MHWWFFGHLEAAQRDVNMLTYSHLIKLFSVGKEFTHLEQMKGELCSPASHSFVAWCAVEVVSSGFIDLYCLDWFAWKHWWNHWDSTVNSKNENMINCKIFCKVQEVYRGEWLSVASSPFDPFPYHMWPFIHCRYTCIDYSCFNNKDCSSKCKQ